MAEIFTPNGIKVTVVYTYQAQRIVNVYYFTNGHAATGAELITLANAVIAWESSSHRGVRSQTSLFALIECRAMDGAGAPLYSTIPTVNLAGSHSPNGSSSYTTIAVKHVTGLGGRSYRGRTYLCGLSSAGISTPDTISAAYQTLINSSFASLRTSCATAGFTFCICSRYSGVDGSGRAIPRASGILTPVTGSQCGIGLDTQRHRKIAGIV